MAHQIFYSASVLALATLILIKVVGGECDKDWKEWLAVSFMLELATMVISALWIIWQ